MRGVNDEDDENRVIVKTSYEENEKSIEFMKMREREMGEVDELKTTRIK